VKPQQLVLFFPPPTLPSRPFGHWSRKLDEIRICTRCGREIISRWQRDEIVSEFVSNDGECWNCTHPR
jgi:hypothetical protein